MAFYNKGDGSTFIRNMWQVTSTHFVIWMGIPLQNQCNVQKSIKYQYKVKCYRKLNKYISMLILSSNFTFENLYTMYRLIEPCHTATFLEISFFRQPRVIFLTIVNYFSSFRVSQNVCVIHVVQYYVTILHSVILLLVVSQYFTQHWIDCDRSLFCRCRCP